MTRSIGKILSSILALALGPGGGLLFAAAAAPAEVSLVRPMRMAMIGDGLEGQRGGLSELKDLAVSDAGPGDSDAAKAAAGMLSMALFFHRVLDFKDAAEPEHRILYREAGSHLLEIAERHRAGPRPDEVPLEALAGLVAGLGHTEGWLTPAQDMDHILARLRRLEAADVDPDIRGHAGNARLAIEQLQALSREGTSEGFKQVYENFIGNYPGRTGFDLEKGRPIAAAGLLPAGNGTISTRKLSGKEDLQAVVDLQRHIHEAADFDMMGLRYLDVLDKIGGHVIGAYYGSRLAGFVLSVPGVRRGLPYLCSHGLRVHPDCRDFGLGTALKLAQRDEALSRGIKLIRWLYDPLQGRNAYLNIAKLGAVVREYRPNYWGSPRELLREGLSVDWVAAEWWLASQRVNDLLEAKQPPDFRVEERILVPARGTREASGRIRDAFLRAFSRGLAVLGYEPQDNKDGVYLLGRWGER